MLESMNSTVVATGLSVRWCPSDPTVSQAQTIDDWIDGPKTFG